MNKPNLSALPPDIQISLYEACDFCPPKIVSATLQILG
ncbi:hypothetical protein QU96_3561 [Acinetobacter baumannii]|nr:hypothetical protein QU96_3561 [Acinetobacter baumannii]